MGTYTTRDGVDIFFKDWGSGQPVLFSHGWPLTADAWDAQLHLVATAGYRAIAHDRRGGGRSSQPWRGNDLTTYADDLAGLIQHLDLRDGRPGRSLDRWGRGHPVRGPLRHPTRGQGGAPRRHPATDAQDRGQPGGAAEVGLRRSPGGRGR